MRNPEAKIATWTEIASRNRREAERHRKMVPTDFRDPGEALARIERAIAYHERVARNADDFVLMYEKRLKIAA
jgi:hypothetical protein